MITAKELDSRAADEIAKGGAAVTAVSAADLPSVVTALMWEAARVAAIGDKARQTVQEKTDGAYTILTRAAVTCTLSDPDHALEVFTRFFESVKTDIATNAGGLAVRIGAQRQKKGKGYKVPQPFAGAAAVLRSAMEHGVPIAKSDGSPRSFTEIREENSEARQTKAREAWSPLAREVRAELDALQENVGEASSLFDFVRANDGGTGEYLGYMSKAVNDALESLRPMLEKLRADKAEAEKPEEEEAGAELLEALAPKTGEAIAAEAEATPEPSEQEQEKAADKAARRSNRQRGGRRTGTTG